MLGSSGGKGCFSGACEVGGSISSRAPGVGLGFCPKWDGGSPGFLLRSEAPTLGTRAGGVGWAQLAQGLAQRVGAGVCGGVC